MRDGILTPATLVARLSAKPAAIFRLPVGGGLAPGQPADITVIDPEVSWTCDVAAFRSRSRNSPFAGRPLRGRAALTMVGGKIAHHEERFRE